MNVDASSTISALNAASPDTTESRYAIAMLRRAQDAERIQGDAAVQLIDAAIPRMTKTSDGHISVRA